MRNAGVLRTSKCHLKTRCPRYPSFMSIFVCLFPNGSREATGFLNAFWSSSVFIPGRDPRMSFQCMLLIFVWCRPEGGSADVLQFSGFAFAVLHLRFCNCGFALVVLLLWAGSCGVCNCGFASLLLQVLLHHWFCNCGLISMVLQVWLCNRGLETGVLLTRFC